MTHDIHGVSCLPFLHMIGQSCFIFETLLLHKHSLIENQLRQSKSNSIKKHIHCRRLSKTHVWPTFNVIINFAYWISLSYSWSSHAIQYSDFGIQCLCKMELDHWYISTVSGNLHSFYFVILQQQTAWNRSATMCAMWNRENQWLSDHTVNPEEVLDSNWLSAAAEC